MFENKSEINNKTYTCIDLEGIAYLWIPPKKRTNRLLITAHGARLTGKKFLIQTDHDIHFYSRDRYSVADPGIDNFFKGKATPTESFKLGQRCYDYDLSKYTNSERNTSHNKSNETYGLINKLITEDYEADALSQLQTLSNASYPPQVTADLVALLNKKMTFEPMSILTIRNRRTRLSTSLSQVLKTLERNGYHYDDVDCLFCRNNTWTGIASTISSTFNMKRGRYTDSVPVKAEF